ncbi:MAG TPA: helix-turn-helix domain-containing protein [Rickettsiales bacterium]|nr:helix-turn-helix domain-containing protein [Rickettsiales bacterium]
MTAEKNETLGELLRKTRLYKQIEIAKICTDLKVKARDIEAIETEKWENFSCNSYKTRLVRSYAKLLQIDLIFIEKKIKNTTFESNINNKKHQLVNIGEDIDLTPNKKMFINFAIISFLVFLVFLVIYNVYESNNRALKTRRIIERVEKFVEQPEKLEIPAANPTSN